MDRAWRVLVTRPEPGASATAAILRDMGFEPVLLPLSETRAVEVADSAGEADAVVVTSATALRHAPATLLARLTALPCFAVGERTADVARAAGFARLRTGGGDAAALAVTVAERLPAVLRLAYLCGRVRLPDFELALAAAGFEVLAIETYDTLSLLVEPDLLRRIIEDGPPDAVLVYSAKAAEALRGLVLRDPAPFRQARFLCISLRVAKALGDLAVAQITSAPEPNEEAMTALLRRIAARPSSQRPFSPEPAMLREEARPSFEIDATEPGMVKTPKTRPSGAQREPVAIELTADAAASGSVAVDPRDDALGDAAGERSIAASPHDTSEYTSAEQPDVASSASEEMRPGGTWPTGAESGPDVVSADTDTAHTETADCDAGGGRVADSAFSARSATSASDEHSASRSSASSPPPYGRAGSGAMPGGSVEAPAAAPPARRAYRGTAFLAGLIGGLMVLVIAGALQFAGLLPSPGTAAAPAAVPEVVQAELAALRADVASLRENATAPSADIQRLSASIEEVRAELASLAQRPGGAAVDLAPLDARLTLLEKAVAETPQQDTQALTALGERVAAVEALVKSSGEALAANTQALATSETRLAGLEQAVSGLTAKLDAQASQPKIARSIAASALKAAIDRGAPFRAELETLVAIVPQSPDLTALQAHAEQGVPTEAEIAADMPAAADAMIAADRPPDQNAGFFDRLLDSAQSMVEVRPIGAVEGTGVPETVARMEVAVNSGDLAAALAEYETLPAPAKAAGAAFAEKIRARVEAIRLADQAIAAAMAAG